MVIHNGRLFRVVIQHFSKSSFVPSKCVSLHGLNVDGKEVDLNVRMGKPKLPLNVAYVILAYHSSWMTSLPIQWCLRCNWTFRFTPYATHHDHLNCFHLTMGAHLSCLECIKCHDFQFGWEGFKHLLPSMVLVSPFSLRNSLRIWPTMKFCPTSLPPSWSNMPCPFVNKRFHIIMICL